MTEIINSVLDSLGWSAEDIVKKKHGSCKAIYAIELIEAILSTESIPSAAEKLDVGEQTLNRILQKTLIPLFGKRTGGGDSWKLVLLTNAEYKYCSSCKLCLKHSNFTKDKYSFDGLDRSCRDCKSIKNKNFYDSNKDTYHKNYIEEHRQDYVARNAARRAAKLQATPSWANLAKIKEIYNTCPKDHHVDHIYPLVSDWVCGLHVENNLQHLPAKENLRKSNKRHATVVE